MTRKTRNRSFIAGLALLLIVIVLLFTFLGGEGSEEETVVEQPDAQDGSLGSSEDVPVDPNISDPFEDPPDDPEEEGQTAARQIAELFAERYGSYSNQGRYQNLRDLLPVMTASYRAETEAFLETVESQPPSETYEGYTAERLSTEEITHDDAGGTAVYDVQLQQVKVVGSEPSETSYPVLRLTLERVDNVWKVASAEWE